MEPVGGRSSEREAEVPRRRITATTCAEPAPRFGSVKKSAYVVELSMGGGGQRRGDVVVVPSVTDVVRVFEAEFCGEDALVTELAGKFVKDGGRVLVWVVEQRGRIAGRIDARPFVTVSPFGGVHAIDRGGLERVLPPLPAPVVQPGGKIFYSPEGKQEGLLGSSYGQLKFGYTDLEGVGPTPHLKRAFPRK